MVIHWFRRNSYYYYLLFTIITQLPIELECWQALLAAAAVSSKNEFAAISTNWILNKSRISPIYYVLVRSRQTPNMAKSLAATIITVVVAELVASQSVLLVVGFTYPSQHSFSVNRSSLIMANKSGSAADAIPNHTGHNSTKLYQRIQPKTSRQNSQHSFTHCY